ncbi:MAG: hypothetical protein ACJ763_11450 [Bdellovibrionia bacterium]
MKQKSRLGRISIISLAGLAALGLMVASQTRLSAFAQEAFAAEALFSAPAGWTQGQTFGSVRSWKGEADRKAYISTMEDDSIKGDVPTSNDKEFIEVTKSASEIPNQFAGIKDWKVEKLERAKLSNGHKIVLIGTYQSAKGELIRFEEWKYFLKDGYGQINYSELAGPKARDRAQVAEILKRYHPFGS